MLGDRPRPRSGARRGGKNARANGCGGAVETRCGDLLEVVDECGDVVIANIIADAILQLAAPVRARIADGGMFHRLPGIARGPAR